MHLTDPHLFADRDEELRGTVTYATLNAVVQHVKSTPWQADRLALTGDLVQDDSPAAYDHLKHFLQQLDLPVLVVPGNHDVRPLVEESFSAPEFDYCGSVSHGAWLLIGVDSCVDGAAGGHVSPAEMDRLQKTIAVSDARHVLVCLHHPPLPVGSRWLDAVGLANGAEFLTAIKQSGRVRGVLFGHAHQAFDTSSDALRILGTPATCRQFLPGSAEFALDDKPPAYRRLELEADGTINTELVWVDNAISAEQRKH